LQASEAVLKKACVPQSDGVASTIELVGDLQIGRPIFCCQAQDQPTAEDQGLRGGVGADERLQALLCFEVQDNRRSKWVWHDDILATRLGRFVSLT